MGNLFSILAAVFRLVTIAAKYAAAQDAKRAGQREIMLSLLTKITENIDAAIKAGHDFDAELHADPDSLLNDDGFKRRSNQIRAPTDTGASE